MPSTYVWTGTTSGAWNTTTNWSPNGTPGAGDTIILDGRMTQAITANPTSSPQLAAIRQYASAGYAFGTAASPIAVSANVVEVGLPAADGSFGTGAEFHINTGTNIGSKFYVYSTKNTGSSSQEPVIIKTGTPSAGSHVLDVSGGVVGTATGAAADTAIIATIGITGGQVNVGAGTTWTTIQVNGGKVQVNSGATSGTITSYSASGQITTLGTSLIGTITGYAGTLTLNHRAASGATVTTLNARGALFDFSLNPNAAIISAVSYRSGTIKVASPTQLTLTAVTLDWDIHTQKQLSAS